jgi:tight adherence protein C
MIPALGVALLILATPAPRLWRRPRRALPGAGDLIVLATLVSLGLDAGMAPGAAIAWSRPYLHPALAGEVTAVARRARLDGLTVGLRSAVGFGSDLFAALARAVETGAALTPVLDAYREGLAADARAQAEARLRRLPVKLVFPLALLMLPGLVLIVSGPALIDVLGRLR